MRPSVPKRSGGRHGDAEAQMGPMREPGGELLIALRGVRRIMDEHQDARGRNFCRPVRSWRSDFAPNPANR